MEDAWQYIFGYTIGNDVTARDLQKGMVNGPGQRALTHSVPLVPGLNPSWM